MPRHALSFAALLLAAMPAYSASLQDAQGLWLSADKAAVIEFKACADAPAALCGQIAWDKDAGTPDDTCGMRIAKLQKFDGNA